MNSTADNLNEDMYYKKIDYNPFSSFVFIVLGLGVYFAIPFVNYYLYVVVIYAIIVIVGVILSKSGGLTIDSDGIFLDIPLRGSDFVPWSSVIGLRRGVKKDSLLGQSTGIGIIRHENNSETDLFINSILLGAFEGDVAKAINQGIDYYVHKQCTTDFVESEQHGRVVKSLLFVGLFLLWGTMSYYICISFFSSTDEPYNTLMEATLINGHRFSILNGAFMAFFVAAVMVIFPNLLVHKKHLWNAGFMILAIAFTWNVKYANITSKQRVYDNCMALSFQSPDTIYTVVDYNTRGRSSNFVFHLEYEQQHYKIEMDYVPGAEKDMPLMVVVRKGAENLPIITYLEIAQKQPKFKWKRNVLGDAYNVGAYKLAKRNEMEQCLKMIDMAIQTDPDEPSYRKYKEKYLFMIGNTVP